MKTVLLASFNESGPAQVLKDRLNQAGYRAVLHNETKLERYGFLSSPLAAFHVEVRPEDFLPARRKMEKLGQTEGLLNQAVHCPACGSCRVEFPQASRKFVFTGLVAVLMALRLVPRDYYCVDCQFTWPEKRRVEPERDILGWPMNSKLWHPETARPAAPPRS